MSTKVIQLQNMVVFALMICILSLCLASVHSISPHEKSPFTQTDSEFIETNSKFAPFSSRSELDGANNDVESVESNPSPLNKILYLLQHKQMPSKWMLHPAQLSAQHKRQIRYQQCYFNPISCFR